MKTVTEPIAPARSVPRAARRQAARVLAQAFTTDPVWVELRPRRSKRADRALYWIFRCEITIAVVLRGYLALTYDERRDVSAVAIAYRRTSRGFPWWTVFFRLPAMVLLGWSRTVQSARMALAAEAEQPTHPHIYAYYAGSVTLGGGAVLMRRVMKMSAREQLPVYGEAKATQMLEMLRVLRWHIATPVDIGYGRRVTPVRWIPPGLDEMSHSGAWDRPRGGE
ncbi:hypothetical protein [Nocardia goodfellowii]|uniref:Uncharacterized protein n=1 Tax=Nocardia goodfellowii TaxID=882446 RepID=A0ABS4QMX7_9NOCA|nr:hypothetical protein [Nocardia goodfellowii]MBP2193060.1 hypothetical protein [Nocardia goodfellowii]